MSDNKIVTPTRRAVLAGAAAALPLLGRRARAADPISIGWVGPLSPPGGYAEGTNMKNAAEIAAAEINAQGGILGRQVEITYADTRGMPAEGRTSAERLIQQNKVGRRVRRVPQPGRARRNGSVPQIRHSLHGVRRVV